MQPDIKSFSARFSQSKAQVVWSKWVADLETPVSAMLKLMRADEPCFLLESVQGGEMRGRYSLIGIDPDLIWRCRGNKAELSPNGGLNDSDFIPCEKPSLLALKDLVRDCRIDLPDGLPPMAAGLIGYMGYDMVKLMERLPDKNPDTIGLPDALFMRPRIMVVFDSVMGELYVIAALWNDHAHKTADAAYAELSARIAQVMQRLQTPLAVGAGYHEAADVKLDFTPNMTEADYCAMVNKAKEYIAAGDIFQVVPSQRFQTKFTLPHFSLYRALRHMNPSPFLFFLHFGGFSLIGSSPEILVRLRDGKATIRPIAGTRKRGVDKAEDAALIADLLADPKEIAEHLMLLDLGRNDVGRIAKTGTVKVTERMNVELYSHVMHIVSNVEGEIDDARFDAIDALIAGFPAGTVSGAPKIRAMEIIDELESQRRSFYAGCVGYFSANGSMDTCITLRTGLIKDDVLYVQAGGGVVADSDPKAEYQESCNKAKAIMKAAQQAAKFV